MLRRRVIRNPKKEIATFTITLVVIVAVFFAVLNYFLSLQHPPTSSVELTVENLRFSLEMPQTLYHEGQPVPLKLSVKNIGTKDVTLKYSQALEYDFVVQKDLNLIFSSVPLDIWRFSTTHPVPGGPHDRVLKPQQSRSYETKWTQVNARGESVGTGRYLITGMVNLAEGPRVLHLRGTTE